MNRILGMISGTSPELLSIHAEVITRIIRLRDDESYLIRPSVIAKLSINYVLKNESKLDVKEKIKDLLDEL